MVVFWVSMKEHIVITGKTTILTRPAVEAWTLTIKIDIYWKTNHILPDDLIHYIVKSDTLKPSMNVLSFPACALQLITWKLELERPELGTTEISQIFEVSFPS